MAGNVKQSASNVIDVADEAVKKKLVELFHNNQKALILESQNFLERIKETEIKLYNVNEKLKIQHQIKSKLKDDESTDVSDLQMKLKEYISYDIQEKELQAFMSEVFKYQQVLNAYLGHEVEVIYVHQTRKGEPILYKLNDTGEEIRKDIASRGGGVSARYLTPSKMKNVHAQEKNNRKFDILGLDSAYATTVKRGRYSKKFIRKNSYLVLWRPQSMWKKMFISSLGDVNEAYAAFFLRNENNPSFRQSDIEDLIDDFLTSSPSGVAYVSNAAGLLEGDVSTGSIEYAIKSKGASTLSYKQVLGAARQIASGDFSLFQKRLDQLNSDIDNTKGTRNKEESIILEDIIENELLKDAFVDQKLTYNSLGQGMLGMTVDFRIKK